MFNARQEVQLLEAATNDGNADRYWDDLALAIEKGEMAPQDFRLADVFDNFVEDGMEIRNSWSMRRRGRTSDQGINLVEAGVSTANFANITGQIIYSQVLQELADPEFVASRCARTIPTEFDGEKIPGVSALGDDAEAISEGHPYPLAGVSEYWIETPATIKRGLIVPVTKEAIFFDRTNLVLQRARDNARVILINKEKRVLDVVLGITSAYRRNGSAAIATYGDNSGTHDWDNLSASTPLQDWTDIEVAELLFDAMTNPETGEPVMVTPNTLIVPTALKRTAQRILSATELRHTTNTSNVTLGGNVLAGDYQTANIISSRYVGLRTGSATTWFIGNPMEAFWYMENWPAQVEQAPRNSEMEFTHDIVERFKISERGAMAVAEPRQMVKATG